MTLAQVFALLNAINGFTGKVVYRAWEEGQVPPMPFITYFYKEDDPFFADGVVYYASQNISINLFTKDKDEASEALVETALKNGGLTFAKSEENMPDEKCYCITYDLGV